MSERLAAAGRWLATRPGTQLVVGAVLLALAFPTSTSGAIGMAVLAGALGVAVVIAWPEAPAWLRSPPERVAGPLVIAIVVIAGVAVFRDILTESPDWQMGDWGPQRAVLAHVMPDLPGFDVPVWNHDRGRAARAVSVARLPGDRPRRPRARARA
jgi:hypothetical protein